MAPKQPHDSRVDDVLQIYSDDPMEDGDVVMLVDGTVCMEITGLATRWDDTVRCNTASVLRRTARAVLVAIARPQARLLPGDLQLWQDLRDALLDDDGCFRSRHYRQPAVPLYPQLTPSERAPPLPVDLEAQHEKSRSPR